MPRAWSRTAGATTMRPNSCPTRSTTHSTVFTFTLEPVPDGTQLTVVETGFDRTSDPAANMASHAEGWVSELDKLVALLEGDA